MGDHRKVCTTAPSTVPSWFFATHYHELTRLPSDLRNCANINVPVRETRQGIVFLYRAAEGPSDRSYGIHVASMAGVPPPVSARAARILARLEKGGVPGEIHDSQMTMDFDTPPEGLMEILRGISPDSLSPRDAQNLLYQIREMLGQ
jgi:DNA mismatch repair protein MutS